jgi:sulfite exporter TauE/SafE/copper chaperone CopZ/plastocyanin
MKEHVYYVSGMHCASCEILIEREIINLKGVKAVEANTPKGEVFIEYEEARPNIFLLNKIFKKHGYIFSDAQKKEESESKKSNIFLILGVSFAVIALFIGLNKLGLSGFINVNSTSSLPMFFVFGLLAGISSCAALVGGIVLSMSKQWQDLYSGGLRSRKFQPHLLFNLGRLGSYAFFGAILGAIGSKLSISLKFTSFLVIFVSIIMIFLALQMLGVKTFRRFQITTPKFITRRIADESKFHGRYMPALLGAATFLLPCGFTIIAQGLALISGSPLTGGLIMFFFALGTLPALLFIGLSSVKFMDSQHLSSTFLKVAGVLVLFFALFNINSQLNVLGLASFGDLGAKLTKVVKSDSGGRGKAIEGLAPIVDGKQVLKMEASSIGYNPDYFRIRVGVPVRWEITDTGTSGCTNVIISKGLFGGEIELTPGKVSVQEFTPKKAGKYKFSCWMGMVSGVIEVVDGNGGDSPQAQANLAGTNQNSDSGTIPSGAAGCDCGGGSRTRQQY